ncbi:DUF2304 domain-containing protein [Alphaproteobacteria bacterium]|nr:DUF2304 domain-containing protein [Alphaproteobacteria bacterium]
MQNEAITLIIVLVSLLFFAGFLLRRISSGSLDVFDALSISLVLILPFGFLLFESVANELSLIIGVEFPFVLMFGMLFLFAFLMLMSLLMRMKSTEARIQKLAQELALERMEQDKKINKGKVHSSHGSRTHI